MSTVPQKFSQTSSQVFAPMDQTRSQSTAKPSTETNVSTTIASAIAIPAAIALVISTYLAYATFTMSEVAGCGSGNVFDCGHVLHSKWSKALGIPVSVFAALTHLSLITGMLVTLSKRFGSRTRMLAVRVVFVAATASFLAALYFISLQIFVLNHLCTYCMGAHACGLIAGSVAIWKLPLSSVAKRVLTATACAGIAVLASIQIASAEPPTYQIIETVAPVDEQKSDDSDSTFDAPNGDAGELFSAPGESNDSEDMDIFAAPTDDGASNLRMNRSFRMSESAIALLQILSGNGLAVANSSMLITSPQATDTESGSAAKSVDQPTTATQSTPKSARLVPMLGGSIKLKSTDWPLVGDPNAKHIFIEMFDYTCEHCRATNRAIKIAKQKLGADLAVLVLPVPMNQSCNPTITKPAPAHAESCELSRLAIAVWRLESEKFADFHQWMFEGDIAPTYANALLKAQEMVGAEALNQELAKSVCKQYVSRNVELYKRAGGGVIPKMIFPKSTIVGKFTSGESLTELIKDYTATK